LPVPLCEQILVPSGVTILGYAIAHSFSVVLGWCGGSVGGCAHRTPMIRLSPAGLEEGRGHRSSTLISMTRAKQNKKSCLEYFQP
jgi:hypothetical protein